MSPTRLFFGALLLGGVAYPVYQQQAPAPGGRLTRPAPAALPLDRWQPKQLPALPAGVTLDMIRQGDSVYRNAGGCATCHGPDAMGLPDKGSGLSLGLNFIPAEVGAIDSLVTAGMPETLTRTTIATSGRSPAPTTSPGQADTARTAPSRRGAR